MLRTLIVLLFICLPWFDCHAFEQEQAGTLASPTWIWANSNRHDPQRIELRKPLQLDAPIQRADLRMATECSRCELRLGGRPILTLDDYGPWLDVDITDHIRAGDEVLALHCEGSEGPSAIVLELTITTIDGGRSVIRSDGGWQAQVVANRDGLKQWQPVQTFGAVAEEYWDADRTARITPFDDYEQWRQASDGTSETDPAKFLLRPGFEIELVRQAAEEEGSWVSLEFDPLGRMTIAREDKGLLRMTLADDGRSISRVETIDDALLECRGLLYTRGSLYAQANNAKGLYRLNDEDGDGRFENKQLVREFPGGVGHGRNDLALGPDQGIYAIFGDSVEVPKENVIDHTSPFREARRGQPTTEGHVLGYFPLTEQWHLLCSGLRNPFGIDFNADGEAFTYDADAEFDMGSPWYRPTRLVHLVPGGDYGWRGRTGSWPPYDADHADFTIPAGDIGKGSPTAVKSGQRSSFPSRYRRAMFALDWAYGRILACHLVPRGSGYVCRAETFLKGRPLNVTDLDFGPDGSLFVITGGRKTRSGLYRVRWIGGEIPSLEPTPQQLARNDYSQSQRESRHRIAAWPNPTGNPPSVRVIWESLGHADPMLRDAARVAIERQPLDQWSDLAFSETRPAWVVPAMLAMARSDQDQLLPQVMQKLLEVPVDSLSGYERSMLLETWSRCLSKPAAQEDAAYGATVDRIATWYPDRSPPIIAPTGAGRTTNHQLALLAESLEFPDLVAKTMQLLPRLTTQEERMHAVFVLRNCRVGWTADSRRTVFETLGELDRTVIGGEGMPGFLRQIREEMVATLTEAERVSLGDLVKPGTELDPSPLSIDRPIVKQWQSSDLDELLGAASTEPDHQRGQTLFRTAHCDRCHRFGNGGGVSGPDLTSVAGRFGRRDILLSILEPSRVVDEKYRNEQVVTLDGRVIVGRVVTGGDYRSTSLRLATDPLRPAQLTEIEKGDIETHRPSPESPMPAGLLDSFSADEIRDLLAYLAETPR